MIDNDMLITHMLFEVLQPYGPRKRGGVFLRLMVKNVMRLDIPEKELDAANVLSSYSKNDRSAEVNILTEHNAVSLRFSFKNLAKDWRFYNYSKGLKPDGDNLLEERNVTFSEIKNWLLQCKSIPGEINYLCVDLLLSLMEKSASHPFVKHLLIKLDGFFSGVIDKASTLMLRAVLKLGKRRLTE